MFSSTVQSPVWNRITKEKTKTTNVSFAVIEHVAKTTRKPKKNIHNISENVWSEVHVWLFLFSSVLLMCVVLTSKNKSSGFFGFIFGYTCGIEIAQIKTKLKFLLVLGRLWCCFLLGCGLKKQEDLIHFGFHNLPSAVVFKTKC